MTLESPKRKIELKALRVNQIVGHVLRFDLPELKEMASLLDRCSNNISQIAKRANESGRIYNDDLKDILAQLNRLWETSGEIITVLAKLNGSLGIWEWQALPPFHLFFQSQENGDEESVTKSRLL